jgi:hypothetical protein
MKVQIKNAFVLACGAAAAILIAGTMSLFISRPAAATSQFAQQTGVPCAQCHQRPDGADGKLTPFGESFKANGNVLPKSPPK